MSAVASFVRRYIDKIRTVLSCFDRVIIQATLPDLCYAGGMTAFLHRRRIRIFDYPRWAEQWRDKLRQNAEALAQENGITIEFVRKATFRKEKRIQEVLQQRGDHPGLVHILSAMESCQAYRPWHDKKTHKTFLKSVKGQCLHYYFYFIAKDFGLCYLRVPTWCPFRLQFYFNGHNYLARQLDKRGIGYKLLDNAFVSMLNPEAAQQLADKLDARRLHLALDHFALTYCPIIRDLAVSIRWSLMQVEFATDIVFNRQDELAPIYETLTRTAIHAVKADDVATFLGRKPTSSYQDELGNNFSTRIEGTRLRHYMGPASIKIYDKFQLVLRIETTANDVSFFKHHRNVEHRDGTTEFKLAPLKKSIYSLRDLRELLAASNRRYIDYISAIDDPSPNLKALDKVTKSTTVNGRNYKGFNFFADVDLKLLEVLVRAEHNISGLRALDIRKHLPDLSAGQVSRLLKRLRTHGLLKRVGRTYKYYLTALGRRVILAGLKLRALFVIPQLAPAPVAGL